MNQFPTGLTGMHGGPAGGGMLPPWLKQPPEVEEMDDMEKAMRCVKSLEPLAMPINARNSLASIAISLNKHNVIMENFTQQQHALLVHYEQRAQQHRAMHSQISMMWWLCAMAVGANVMAIILRAFD